MRDTLVKLLLVGLVAAPSLVAGAAGATSPKRWPTHMTIPQFRQYARYKLDRAGLKSATVSTFRSINGDQTIVSNGVAVTVAKTQIGAATRALTGKNCQNKQSPACVVYTTARGVDLAVGTKEALNDN